MVFHERGRRDKKGSKDRPGYSAAYPRGAERIAMRNNLKMPYGVSDYVVFQFKGTELVRCEHVAEDQLEFQMAA